MHAARLSTSKRLQDALRALQSAAPGELSTRDIIMRTGVCAVNAVIAELRDNGAKIACRQECRDGRRVFFYRLDEAPEDWNE